MIRSSLCRRESIRLEVFDLSREATRCAEIAAMTSRPGRGLGGYSWPPLIPSSLGRHPRIPHISRVADRQRRGNAHAVRDTAQRGETGREVLLSLVITVTAKLVGRIRPAATRAVAVSCRGCCRGEHRGARIKLGALVPGLKTSVEAIIFRAVHTRRARPQGKEHEQNQYCFPPLSPSLSPCRG